MDKLAAGAGVLLALGAVLYLILRRGTGGAGSNLPPAVEPKPPTEPSTGGKLAGLRVRAWRDAVSMARNLPGYRDGTPAGLVSIMRVAGLDRVLTAEGYDWRGPMSIVAQETGYGITSGLRSNNPWGISHDRGDGVYIVNYYDTLDDGVRAFLALMHKPLYATAWRLKADPAGYLNACWRAGYNGADWYAGTVHHLGRLSAEPYAGPLP